MVNGLTRHEAKWLAPQPLWRNGGVAVTDGANGSAWQPAILRFDNDLFMDEVLAVLAYAPDRLPEWVAQPETWQAPLARPGTAGNLKPIEPVTDLSKRLMRRSIQRERAGTSSAPAATMASKPSGAADDGPPFKLYQPAHQRFYLVTASLVCQQYGMPDRRVDAGKQESANFVIRRVVHEDTAAESTTPDGATDARWSEFAYVATPDGYAWAEIPPAERTAVRTGEERLPLFALNFAESGDRRRRMFAGLIPVGKREAYLGAPRSENDERTENGKTITEEERTEKKGREALRALFDAKVTAPWVALIRLAKGTHETLLPALPVTSPIADRENEKNGALNIIKATREQIQNGSWYIILDFAKFLEKNLTPVWKKLKNEDPGRLLTDQEGALVTKLKEIVITGTLSADLRKGTGYGEAEVPHTLADALVLINTAQIENGLESVDVAYDREGDPIPLDVRWPRVLFPLADVGVSTQGSNSLLPYIKADQTLAGPLDIDVGALSWDQIDTAFQQVDDLAELVEKALPPMTATTVPPEIEKPKLPLDVREGWFVIRCVFERPNCGLLHPAAVSIPTEKFQMASFFDPDAPARQVRISLPMDISPAGLRKFKKNATLMMSDMLCGKVGEIRKLTFGDLVLSVLPWPFHKDLPNPGKTGPCKDNSGMYCSLSIPIVTLAALILLIIIVALFDMFFHWIPWLFTCFPIPGMKAKKT